MYKKLVIALFLGIMSLGIAQGASASSFQYFCFMDGCYDVNLKPVSVKQLVALGAANIERPNIVGGWYLRCSSECSVVNVGDVSRIQPNDLMHLSDILPSRAHQLSFATNVPTKVTAFFTPIDENTTVHALETYDMNYFDTAHNLDYVNVPLDRAVPYLVDLDLIDANGNKSHLSSADTGIAVEWK
jgi:hypothetical protein